MSAVFQAFVKSTGSSLIVGSACHKNTNAKVELANGVIGDTLRAYANGRKDDWDSHLPLAEFAINNAASSLDDGLTPALAAVRRQHRHSPMRYAGRMHEIDGQLFDSCWAAQAEQKAKLDAGRVDSVYTIGDRKLLRTKEASRCRRHW